MSTKIFVISFDMLRHYGESRKQETFQRFLFIPLVYCKTTYQCTWRHTSVPGTERTAESSSVGRVANQRPTCAHVTQQRQAQQRRHVTSPAMVKLHVVSDVSMLPLTAAAVRCVIILCRNQRRRWCRHVLTSSKQMADSRAPSEGGAIAALASPPASL